MQVLAIHGSPRVAGNTDALLELVLDGARQGGAETEVVRLAELENLTGCRECYGCQDSTTEPGCVVEDDMQPILSKALEADVIVFATPVFCWSPCWLLKMALDRFFCMLKFQEDEIRSLLEGHRMAMVITAGGGEDEGADLVAETCRRMAEYTKCTWSGSFVAGYAKDPEGIRADQALGDRARTFGRQLIA